MTRRGDRQGLCPRGSGTVWGEAGWGWKDIRCGRHWIPGYGPQSSRAEPGVAWQRSGLIYQRRLRRLKGGVLGKAVRPHTEGHRGAKGPRLVDGGAGRPAPQHRDFSALCHHIIHPPTHPTQAQPTTAMPTYHKGALDSGSPRAPAA